MKTSSSISEAVEEQPPPASQGRGAADSTSGTTSDQPKLGSFRSIIQNVNHLLDTRLALLQIETEELVENIKRYFSRLLALSAFVFLALFTFVLCLIFICPVAWRPWVFGGISLISTLFSVYFYRQLTRATSSTPLFEHSLLGLKKDLTVLLKSKRKDRHESN
jgi:uncharacterized membrane protein YqjE